MIDPYHATPGDLYTKGAYQDLWELLSVQIGFGDPVALLRNRTTGQILVTGCCGSLAADFHKLPAARSA